MAGCAVVVLAFLQADGSGKTAITMSMAFQTSAPIIRSSLIGSWQPVWVMTRDTPKRFLAVFEAATCTHLLDLTNEFA